MLLFPLSILTNQLISLITAKSNGREDGSWTSTNGQVRATTIREKVANRSIRSRRNIVIAIFCLLGLGGGTWTFVESNTNTIYKVTFHGQMIGYISSPKIVETWKSGNQIDHPMLIEAERRFNGISEDTTVLKRLKQVVKSEAVAMKVNGKKIGYVKNEKEAGQILNLYKKKYLSSQPADLSDKKNTVRMAARDLQDKKNTSKRTEVFLKEQVTFEKVHVQSPQILDQDQMHSILSQGLIEPIKHKVKSGESIWTIAQRYGLLADEVYQMNPDLKGELLQIGQELKVSAIKPLLTVVTVEEVTETEVIPFSVESRKDLSLPQGERKVLQQGEKGLKTVLSKVVNENGSIKSKEILKVKIIKPPVSQIIVEGKKVISSRGSVQYSWPTNGGRITSSYGPRWGKMHKGIDIASADLQIKAADQGVVELAEWDGKYGQSVVINHKNGQKTRYAHMSEISVKPGQKVERGQTIGIMGDTGDSTGIHLHFEILKNGTQINPLKFVRG